MLRREKLGDSCNRCNPTHYSNSTHIFSQQGLEWMLRREKLGDSCNRGVLSLHPAWTQLVNKESQVLYVNRWVKCGHCESVGMDPLGKCCTSTGERVGGCAEVWKCVALNSDEGHVPPL